MSELRKESRSASQFAGKRVHFIGIGGSGMSGLARMLLDSGAIVTGSEPRPNAQTLELTRRGATISREQIGEMLSKDVDLVVRTAAVPDTNEEFKRASENYGLRHVKYAEMLGMVMRERLGIAVAGTHGKSTTSAMIAWALSACGADPSFVIGGNVPQLGGGSRSGQGNTFVAEACEFDRSFHHLHPRIALITNIDADHLDCYGTLDAIVDAFRTFAARVPANGRVITSATDGNVARAMDGLNVPIERCALQRARATSEAPPAPLDWQSADWVTRILGVRNGCYRGEISYKGDALATIQLAIAGEHNLMNATMAVAACRAVGIDPQRSADALAKFTGVDRRMTELGRRNGATIVDDYGHHPTEIRATLRALREKYQPQRLFCVFQPHQASRTRLLIDDFATAFCDATEVILPDIYCVRDSEQDRAQISSEKLAGRIRANGQQARHLPRFDQIIEHLRRELRPGDLVVTMGAGNVHEIGRELIE